MTLEAFILRLITANAQRPSFGKFVVLLCQVFLTQLSTMTSKICSKAVHFRQYSQPNSN